MIVFVDWIRLHPSVLAFLSPSVARWIVIMICPWWLVCESALCAVHRYVSF